jgi:membrane protein implicated in regulation of membrane protease activity
MKPPTNMGKPPTTRGAHLGSSGLVCCLALKAIYGLESAHYKIRAYGSMGCRGLTQLASILCPAGRPILFLVALCLVAAGSLALVDPIPAVMFLLAGCAAVVVFVSLARRPVVNQRTHRPDQDRTKRGWDLPGTTPTVDRNAKSTRREGFHDRFHGDRWARNG